MEGKIYRVKLVMIMTGAAFLTVIFCNNELVAEEEGIKPRYANLPIEASADIAIYSKYIWRGIKLDDDPVLQSGAHLNGYGFELSLWGSFGIDSEDSLDSDEVDYSAGYAYDLKETLKVPASISGGYTYYAFPPAKTNSQEFYVGCCFDVILSPGFTWYHDFEDEDEGGGDGDYIVAELSHSFTFPDIPVSLDLSGHAGYNHELFINGEGSDVGFGTALTFQLARNCTLSPSVNYSIPFGDLEDSNDGGRDDELYGGLLLALGF